MSLALAQRIEGVNTHSLLEHTAVAARLFPALGVASIDVAGGVAAFVGAESPLSYAVGLGLAGPVTADDVARVVEFYRARDAVPRIDICPFADDSLLDALRRHNFQLHWFVNVLTRPLAGIEIPPLPEGIRVRLAEPDEDELWARVVDEGFADGGPMTEPRRQLGLMIFHREHTLTYFAEIGTEIAGAGALIVRAGYSGLAATSVRVPFRNRGVHAALIRARLRKAQELGHDLAGFFASPGSTSERNAFRHGFALAYTKATLKKG